MGHGSRHSYPFGSEALKLDVDMQEEFTKTSLKPQTSSKVTVCLLITLQCSFLALLPDLYLNIHA